MTWNLWIYDDGWSIHSSYGTEEEARAKGQAIADSPSAWTVVRQNSAHDNWLRRYTKERTPPWLDWIHELCNQRKWSR
jgi:hypothetical protein